MPSQKFLVYTVVGLNLAASAYATSSYTWPDPKIDTLEFMLYEQSGFDVNTPAAFIIPCGQLDAIFGPGRSVSAEWLRTAYHDMATADIDAGTGGIDASIGFELQDRDENPGVGFSETLGILRQFLSPQSSMADMIALGAITAVEACANGKIRIPFRGGRVDATRPGPTGVPKPQEDLATHQEAFRRQGFNQEEMIGLVACGHTLGGVHGKDFPEIVDVTTDTATDENTQDFDETISGPNAFDNTVAVDFVANKTQNPLAFGHNETTRSDARIFNADGGSLIRKMAASNAFFLKTCGTLLARMLDTVPKSVTLSDVILPIEVKPSRLYATINTNGTMTVTGLVRIMEPAGENINRKVNIHFIPRAGAKTNGAYVVGTAKTNAQMWSSVITGSIPAFFRKYAFEALLPLSQGVSGFNVEVIDILNGVSNTTLYTNGGNGFPLNDAVLTQPLSSCAEQSDKGALRLTVATRDDAHITSLQAIVHVPTPLGSLTPHINSTTVHFKKVGPIRGSRYTSWTASHNDQPGTYIRVYDLVATDGKMTTKSNFNEMYGLPGC